MSGWTLDPELFTGMRLESARKHAEKGELGECIIELEELLDDSPDHPMALLMLGVGTTLTLADFRRVVARPRAALVGLASQIGVISVAV